jgi:hypothetical protein
MTTFYLGICCSRLLIPVIYHTVIANNTGTIIMMLFTFSSFVEWLDDAMATFTAATQNIRNRVMSEVNTLHIMAPQVHGKPLSFQCNHKRIDHQALSSWLCFALYSESLHASVQCHHCHQKILCL